MNIQELKTEHQSRFDNLIRDCQIFFAFSQKQFDDNKPELKDGDKYVSIGAGGYMIKSQVDNYRNGADEIEKWYTEEIKKNDLKEQEILYELSDHECFYTGDIESAVNVLPNYTAQEVYDVYVKYRNDPRYEQS